MKFNQDFLFNLQPKAKMAGSDFDSTLVNQQFSYEHANGVITPSTAGEDTVEFTFPNGGPTGAPLVLEPLLALSQVR
jgi:hypothetical protein